MSLYDEVINSPKFKKFVDIVDGKNTSSPTQKKRGNIQVVSKKDNAVYVIYSNGTLRKNKDSDRLGKIYQDKNFPENPTIDDMNRLLDKLIEHVERVQSQAKKRRIKLHKYGRKIIDMLFYPDSYVSEYGIFFGWKNIINNSKSDDDIFKRILGDVKSYKKK